MKTYTLTSPFNKSILRDLKVGDTVIIQGDIFTARDAAHKRLVEMLNHGQPLPVDFTNAAIYYAGPCPAKPGHVIGSVGPTTSGRMDAYSVDLIEKCGVSVMIGKGERSDSVRNAIAKNNCLYLVCIGGCGALKSHNVVDQKIMAFDDLGTEAIRKLSVKNFKCYVGIDTQGNCIYDK